MPQIKGLKILRYTATGSQIKRKNEAEIETKCPEIIASCNTILTENDLSF